MDVAPQHCPSQRELTDFAARALATHDSDRIRDHLDICDPCRLGIMAGLSRRHTEPARTDLELAQGLQLGHFEIGKRLGAGGMGVVYEAIDQRLGRAVALKLVRGGDATGDARLLAEARAMARVRHPSVLTVYEAGTFDGRGCGSIAGSVYLATELIRGSTLRGYVREQRPSVSEVFALYRSAVQGLAAAHAHGVVHRDFKPDNVLVERGSPPRVLVADFGLATAMGPGTAFAGGSSSGGTPGYMAPEQLDALPHDERVDVFGVTVALWESLFGKRPFVGSTLRELRAAMDRLPVVPRSPKLPRGFAALLLRGLAVDPARRPRLWELEAALRPRSSRTLTIAGGLVAAAAIAGGLYASRPATEDLGARCAATPTPAIATAGWEQRAIATGVPAWVRARVSAELGDRDREVVSLQRVACADPDPVAQRAWRGCRDAQAIEETELARALGAPWKSYDHLGEALELPWPSTCSSRAARLDLVVAPSDPVRHMMADVAAGALARSWLSAVSGAPVARWHAELAEARVAGAVAGGAIEPAVLEVEAEVEPGLGMTDRLARREHAVELAERGGYSSLAASGWLALAVARGDAKVDAAEIDVAFAQASWAIERAGDPPMLRARWHAASASRAWQRSDLAGANQHAQAAAALAGNNPHRRRIAVLSLAAAAAARADFPAQRTLLESLLADPVVAGARDADAARLQALYAECLYHLDALAPAQAAAERALAISSEASGPRDPLTAGYLVVRGMIELAQGHADRATASVDQAIAVLTETVGPMHLSVGSALNLRSSARAELADWRGALADSEAAAALFSRALGPHVEEVIFARQQIGEQAEMLGDHARARASLVDALGDARTTYGPDDPRTADIEVSLAGLYARDHRTPEARTLTEHALRAHLAAQTAPVNLAQSQALLAHLIATDNPGRARTLADAALAAWRDQDGWRAEYAELDRWRSSH